MRRSRTLTLASYFSVVPANRVQAQAEEPPPSLVPEKEIDGSASAPPPSQGTGQETVGTRVSATQTQTQLNNLIPLTLHLHKRLKQGTPI
jgi:hypothetical protein